ncbi:putative IRON-SULFUR-BINDING REDUCTASE domain protein [Mycobacterium xenopi 3993]|nr:putative IRON-SULFUR-BINDING REDUCTASE domain protein [Mycobacterium xenopi 3993]
MVDSGLAHFFTMWGFFILLTVYIEAYGLLFQPNFHIPVIGRWDVLGFLQDFFATAVFVGFPRLRSSASCAVRAKSAGHHGFTARTPGAPG